VGSVASKRVSATNDTNVTSRTKASTGQCTNCNGVNVAIARKRRGRAPTKRSRSYCPQPSPRNRAAGVLALRAYARRLALRGQHRKMPALRVYRTSRHHGGDGAGQSCAVAVSVSAVRGFGPLCACVRRLYCT